MDCLWSQALPQKVEKKVIIALAPMSDGFLLGKCYHTMFSTSDRHHRALITLHRKTLCFRQLVAFVIPIPTA